MSAKVCIYILIVVSYSHHLVTSPFCDRFESSDERNRQRSRTYAQPRLMTGHGSLSLTSLSGSEDSDSDDEKLGSSSDDGGGDDDEDFNVGKITDREVRQMFDDKVRSPWFNPYLIWYIVFQMTQDATDAASLFENDNDIEITGSRIQIPSQPARLKLGSLTTVPDIRLRRDVRRSRWFRQRGWRSRWLPSACFRVFSRFQSVEICPGEHRTYFINVLLILFPQWPGMLSLHWMLRYLSFSLLFQHAATTNHLFVAPYYANHARGFRNRNHERAPLSRLNMVKRTKPYPRRVGRGPKAGRPTRHPVTLESSYLASMFPSNSPSSYVFHYFVLWTNFFWK